MKKISLIISIITLSIVYNANAYAQQPSVASNCSYILIDSKSGEVMAEYNADKKMRPASTTKIMTAILALENGDLNAEMKVSKEAVYDIGEGGMNIGIMPGESNLTLENLLNVMLIKSANETANIVAENICNTRDEFVEKMNEKAAELGAFNTHFVNTCGKDDTKEEANHLSTARDMAAIARYAMTIPEFRSIVKKEYYNDMPVTDKHQKWDVLRTTNRLLWSTDKYPYTLDGQDKQYTVNGIKTGYTSAAGNNVICSATGEDGMELIAVVMHVTEANNKVFSYAKELLKYGFENYSNQKVISGNQFIKRVDVQGAKDNQKLDLVTQSDLVCAMPVDKSKWDIASEEKINEAIMAPVKKGDVLGAIEYKMNNVMIGKVDLIASQDITQGQKEKTKELSKKLPIKKILITLLVVVVFFLALRVFLRNLSLKLKRRNKYKF